LSDESPVGSSPFVQLVATGLIAAGLTWGIARASVRTARETDPRPPRGSGATVRLVAPAATYVFHPGSGKIVARTRDGATARDIALELVVDGEVRPLALERAADTETERNAFGASFGVTIGDELFDALVSLRVDPGTGALVVDLSVQPDSDGKPPPPPPSEEPKPDEPSPPAHQFALRFEVPSGGHPAFVSGVGELGDLGSPPATGRALEIDADPHAIGIAPAGGALDVAALIDSPDDPHASMRIAATTTPQGASLDQPAQMGLRFLLAQSSAAVWGPLYELAGETVAKITGVVTGLPGADHGGHGPDATERASVFGLDAEGLPRVRARVGEGGRFMLMVPQSISLWYAAIDPSRTSAPVSFTSGLPWDLRLDVSPGGELLARVLDADTGKPLTARLLVHGIDGTLDPSFGPDYRASGAGPIIDSLHGEVATPLPTGRYRVSATKGIEWSIDDQTVNIVSGHSAAIDLSLRHVVPTPGVVGCDLHVHARPSFDSPVLSEDRVLSLVSAGVDFAVPSEHNLIGDYAPALEALDLTRDLATVNGVEITTFYPRFGHFGLFPYAGPKIPPFKATNINAVFNFAHKNAPNAVLQVNHPRLGKGIGYFDVFHFDPRRPPPFGMRTDFDTLEVYNGYESRTAEQLDVDLHDWYALLNMGFHYAATGSSDSHRIQYQWAGYPRTMAIVGEEAGGDHGAPIDPQAVVAAIKKGHSFVTSGPMIELSIAGAGPGDQITTEDTVVQGHLRIRAAPWIDVASAELVVGGKSAETIPIASRPLLFGPELGDRAEAEARTIRYDADVSVPVGPESTWIVVVVRGDRKMDDALPFMPVAPRAFTNPIYVRKSAPVTPPTRAP
jgi:hypothetical protein